MAKADDTHKALRRIPAGYLTTPARIHILGYLIGQGAPQEAEDRFKRLVEHLGIGAAHVHPLGSGAFAVEKDGSASTYVKLHKSVTHYTVQTWFVNRADLVIGQPAERPPETIFPSDRRLTELDILWLDEPVDEEKIDRAFTSTAELLSSSVMGDTVRITTDYEPNAEGIEQYLLYPLGGKLAPMQMELMVDNIARIENHFHLLYVSMNERKEAITKLRDFESETAGETKRLHEDLRRANTGRLKQELHELSDGFAQISELNEEFQQYHREIANHENKLRSAFEVLREQPVDGYLPLSALVMKNATELSGKCDEFFARIERLRRQKTVKMNILRTKIDLLDRDLSLSLQQSLDKTTKSQVVMQRTVEGLYVFVVAFYLTELARIVFEALEEREVIHASPNFLAALFIPVAILAGLVLAGKIGEWRAHWRSSRNRK